MKFSSTILKRKLSLILFIWAAALSLNPGESKARNLHIIDRRSNGYAIYRSGAPSKTDLAAWCRLGITEVLVTSGDSKQYEKKYASLCPGLRVVKDVKQNVKEPLRASFLRSFDRWVSESMKQGRRILFRCVCGCHRTGRLAAYYEMKYLKRGISLTVKRMLKFGQNMDEYPFLIPQVRGLHDYIKHRQCSQSPKYCPIRD